MEARSENQLSETTKIIETSEVERYAIKKDDGKYYLGVVYMFGMAVCGVVLVALGSTLDELAQNCNTEATKLGTVFIARGVGAVFGAIASARLYLWFEGNHVMGWALFLLTAVLGLLPFNTSTVLLHVYFLLLGIGTSIVDTGCQIMTRKVHGKNAGPWLGANTVAFGVAGAGVPLIELLTNSVSIQYYVLTAAVLIVCILITVGPNPEKDKPAGSGPARAPPRVTPPHFYVEAMIGLMILMFIGGKVTCTAYLTTYVLETGVLTAHAASMLILVLWIAITIGRVCGVQDQRFITNRSLPIHLTIFCAGGTASMLLVLSFPDSVVALWIGVAFYGLCNGPCVAYCYDLVHRLTLPSETGMSIVMFGLNFGASAVPYLTALVWSEGGGPITLIISTLLTMLLPLPLLHTVKYFSYDPAANPLLTKVQYSDLMQKDDADTEVSA
ncbi:major facilitator superfamily domain-containing protein [Ochromonadaceae sp. CCMP2298]|nr:major facilitator superfamily domain-containing protein [Ochromonadaceae sp. CCMP2298]